MGPFPVHLLFTLWGLCEPCPHPSGASCSSSSGEHSHVRYQSPTFQSGCTGSPRTWSWNLRSTTGTE